MFTDFLISRGSQVREAMYQLEATESKTLFVIGDDVKLLGTLTDGDVRRWILDGGELDGLVEDVCNPKPFITTGDDDPEELKKVMLTKNITCIPVVDPDGKIRDVLLWDRLFADDDDAVERKKIDLPVVIMAGGFGTRLSPFTSVLPKPLIPVGGKTVVEMIVEAFTAYGVDDFYLSVNYKSKIIKSYFEELDPPYSVDYLYEEKPLGTAGSLRGLIGRVETDFIVTNCDVIINADFHDLVRHHQAKHNDITLVVSLKNYKIPYGVCEIENGGTLRQINEKPAFDYLINTGLYVLKPDVLRYIPEAEPFHVTDLIAAVQQDGGRVGVFPISDKAWVDTGEWTEYRAAVATLTADRRRSSR